MTNDHNTRYGWDYSDQKVPWFTRRTFRSEITVRATNLPNDLMWQELEIEYWNGLAESAPDENYRLSYLGARNSSIAKFNALRALASMNKLDDGIWPYTERKSAQFKEDNWTLL